MLLLLERNGLFFYAIFSCSNPFLCLISVLHGMYVVNVHLPFSIKDHAETKPMKSIVADICDTESIEDVFDNVDVVFHCAALINFQFPPNVSELERVNVDGKFFIFFDLLLHGIVRFIALIVRIGSDSMRKSYS